MAEQLIRAGGQVPILCLAYYDLAVIHHEWNNLQKAWECWEQGFTLSERSGNLEFQQAGYLLGRFWHMPGETKPGRFLP